MCRVLRTIAIVGITLAASVESAGQAVGLAAEPDTFAKAGSAAVDGVLLLDDGGVLAGRISRQDGRYVVKLERGEISVPPNQVELVACSLRDAYDEQRRLMTHPTAESHLRLAEWCLRHNLGPQAARELVDVRGLEPHHPKLALLEHRLAVLGAVPADTGSQPLQAAPPDTSSRDELDRLRQLAGSLPDGALEQFTRKVQPVLVNSCTAADCHQPGGGQAFQLDRAILYGMSNRRTTLRNLAATLELVDRDAPAQSELLTVPRRAHGGMDQAVFGPRQDQLFKHLADWVATVTRPTPPGETAIADAPAAQRSIYERSGGKLVEPVRRVTYEAGRADGATTRQGDKEKGGQGKLEAVATRSVSPPLPVSPSSAFLPWQPNDPFDPEIFNRQLSSHRQSNESAPQGQRDPGM